MGRTDEESAVVDTRLRVRGVARLRVIDASIMPITSGNTASPTVMIAEKAAAAVIEDRRVARQPEVAIAPGPSRSHA